METLFPRRLLPPVGGLYDWDLTKRGLRRIQCSLLQIAYTTLNTITNVIIMTMMITIVYILNMTW